MANHFRLYGRPLMADEVEADLSVTGELEGYTAGDAYESRLQINNSVGRCTVRVIESSLPPGAFVRVDNLTKEVVVKWAAYEEVVAEESLVPNGDFEDGDDGTWNLLGPGWSIGTGAGYAADSGVYSARFADVKTKGSDILLPAIPAKVNDYIKVTARVKQGASSSGNAGARVWLTYHDAAGLQIGDHPGNLITSGKDGAWGTSSAEGGAPANTAQVLVRLAAYRNKQNKPLWVDNVTWNHKYVLGQDDDSMYFLSIAVTDSLNRVAYWQGDIEEYGVFVTSKPYVLDAAHDSFHMAGASMLGIAIIDELVDTDTQDESFMFSGVSVRSVGLFGGAVFYTAGDESFLHSGVAVSSLVLVDQIRVSALQGPETFQTLGPSMQTVTLYTQIINSGTYVEEFNYGAPQIQELVLI